LLVFAHGNFIRSFLPRLAGMDADPRLVFDISHASVTIVERWLSGKVVARLVNCVCHLKPGDR
jgi:broad specificity phosphatase PhoE